MAQARILYVEDYPVVQTMFVEVLRQTFNVDVANDGKEALDKITKNDYDAVLLDLLLPQVSGLEFLRTWQKITPQPNATAQVIVLTDFDNPETREDVMSLGVKHYWIKVEITPHVLVDKLELLLEKSES